MLFLIGFFSGIITAIGMGGGTVLVLLLTLVLMIPQQVAQSANLIFFIPTAITVIVLNIKEKNIDIKVGINIILFGIIGASLGSIIATKIDVKNLKKFFGIFLICIAIHEIYNYYKLYIKSKNTNNKIE
jgi:uncharacterized membrane protein YfcA